MIVSANSSTSAGGLASAATGMRPTRCGASHDQRGDVGADQLARPRGRCTLTTTSSPVMQRRRVHLRDRRRRDRLLVERREDLVERPPSSSSTTARTSANGSGGTWSRQELELGDELVGEEALAAGDDLAELHVGRAEPLERPPQAPGDAGARARPAPSQDEPRRPAQRRSWTTTTARRDRGEGSGPAPAGWRPRRGCPAGCGRRPSATGLRRDRGPRARAR